MKFDNTVQILVVEDDQVDVMALKRAFKKEGITNPVTWAENGIEALEMLRGLAATVSKPRIVILDINMPRMTGLEFLDVVRADPELESLIVFIFTTSRQESDIAHAFGRQVAAYVVKPSDGAGLREAVKRLRSLWEISELPGEPVLSL